MPTDAELTTLLRRGFAHATADLDPRPDLVRVIHSRHVSARRRRVVVALAVPVAAIAAGYGLALAAGSGPNQGHTAVAPPSASASSGSGSSTTPHTSVPVKFVSYGVDHRVVRRHHSAPANCPANATAPLVKAVNPAGVPGVWISTNEQCVFVAVGGADTKPGNAAPLHITGFPGIFSTVENGVRTIYAPGIGGKGWWVLKMPATAPYETAVHLILVPGS